MSSFDTLSLLVHAGSKVGKSTLGATCPPPILILDAEGSTKFIPIAKIGWDPVQGPPPPWDGTWQACVVVVRDFNAMLMAYQWLIQGQHHFRSVVVDSISEVQRKLKQQLVGTEAMKMQQWGELLTKMDALIRGYRDLTLHPWNPLQVAMFIAETRETNGKWKPYLQGQIAVALPYWMDIVGYLYAEPAFDPSGNPIMLGDGRQQYDRKLLIAPHPLYETGERVQGRLPDVIVNPHVTAMLYTIFPHLAQAAGYQTA